MCCAWANLFECKRSRLIVLCSFMRRIWSARRHCTTAPGWFVCWMLWSQGCQGAAAMASLALHSCFARRMLVRVPLVVEQQPSYFKNHKHLIFMWSTFWLVYALYSFSSFENANKILFWHCGRRFGGSTCRGALGGWRASPARPSSQLRMQRARAWSSPTRGFTYLALSRCALGIPYDQFLDRPVH